MTCHKTISLHLPHTRLWPPLSALGGSTRIPTYVSSCSSKHKFLKPQSTCTRRSSISASRTICITHKHEILNNRGTSSEPFELLVCTSRDRVISIANDWMRDWKYVLDSEARSEPNSRVIRRNGSGPRCDICVEHGAHEDAVGCLGLVPRDFVPRFINPRKREIAVLADYTAWVCGVCGDILVACSPPIQLHW